MPENAPTNMSVVRRPGADPVPSGRDPVQAAIRRVRPTPLSPHTSEAARRSAVRKGFGVQNAPALQGRLFCTPKTAKFQEGF